MIVNTRKNSFQGGMMWWRWFGRLQLKAITDTLSLFRMIPIIAKKAANLTVAALLFLTPTVKMIPGRSTKMTISTRNQ